MSIKRLSSILFILPHISDSENKKRAKFIARIKISESNIKLNLIPLNSAFSSLTFNSSEMKHWSPLKVSY